MINLAENSLVFDSKYLEFINSLKESITKKIELVSRGVFETEEKKTDSDGMNSGRGCHYKIPKNDKKTLALIKKDRAYIKTLIPEPDEVFEIKRPKGKNGFKGFKVSIYGSTKAKLQKIIQKRLDAKEPVFVGSYHGASHSFAMLNVVIKEKLPLDFLFYADVPIEMEGETDQVIYTARILHNVPLVLIQTKDDPLWVFYKKKAFPTKFKRWCTNEFKLIPYKFVLSALIRPLIKRGMKVPIFQYLGIQAFQSDSRSKMNPYPSLSKLSNETFKIFDINPVFPFDEEFNKETIKCVGGIQSCNERQYGRHGCLVCVFSGWRWFQHLKETEPEKYEYALKLREASCRYQVEEGTRQANKPYIVYRMSKKALKENNLKASPY